MINQYENELRRIIILLLGSTDNSEYKVSNERIEKWKEKREIESIKNKGFLLEKRLLYFSDLYDLGVIISKNWELFKPILKEKKRFEVFFSEIESFRNTIAHGRNLTSSQENLLEGITKDLKNLITMYHNKNENLDDYFIRIDNISDNFGNTWNSNSSSSKVILRVDDEYELLIEAIDPKGRDIEYEINFGFGVFKITQATPRFLFTIPSYIVGSTQMLFVKVRTPNSEYDNSDLKSITVSILPKP